MWLRLRRLPGRDDRLTITCARPKRASRDGWPFCLGPPDLLRRRRRLFPHPSNLNVPEERREVRSVLASPSQLAPLQFGELHYEAPQGREAAPGKSNINRPARPDRLIQSIKPTRGQWAETGQVAHNGRGAWHQFRPIYHKGASTAPGYVGNARTFWSDGGRWRRHATQEKRRLEAWESEFVLGDGEFGTSDCPGWGKYIGPPPGRPSDQ